MSKSRQRLGDDPRHYDGYFKGVEEGRADVSGVRPDAAYHVNGANTPKAESNPPPWNIYPRPPPPHWHWTDSEKVVSSEEHGASIKGGEFTLEECAIPPVQEGWDFRIDDKGVFQVYDDTPSSMCHPLRCITPLIDASVGEEKKPAFEIPGIREYFVDLDYVLSVIADGPTKSFAFRRLKYLASKFTMYCLLNEFQELTDMKVCPQASYLLFISLRV